MGPPEDLDWRRPDPALARLRRTQIGIVAGVALASAVVVAVWASVPVGAALAVGAAAACAGADVVATRRVWAWGYAERNEDLLVRRGILVQRLSVVPYGRMQYVDVVAGPLERAFGLAGVRMHTAAAASDARIPGLTADDAARLRDRLATLGEHQASGL